MIVQVKSFKSLSKRVTSKLEEGNLKGAITLTSSNDRLAPFNLNTFMSLSSLASPP